MTKRHAFATVIAAFGLAAAAAAQPLCPNGPFLAAEHFPTTLDTPQAVAVADFTGDTKADVVAIGQYEGIAVLPGNGDGTFGAPIVTAGTGGDALVVGDFDGDGKADVAVVGYPGVNVYLGNGDGSFQAATPYDVPGGFNETIIAVDLDGNGTLDLVVANSRGEIYVLLGNGNGTFGAYTAFPTPGNSVAAGDFNGDGAIDLALNAGGSVSILDGHGDGTFAEPRYLTVGGGVVSVAVADVNHDGKPDIAVALQAGPQFAAGQVAVLLGNGDGTFQAAAETFVGEVVSRLALQDLDGDGNVDALVIAGEAGRGGIFVGVLRGDGSASFATVTEYLAGPPAIGIAAADLDGDGLADIATLHPSTAEIGVLRNNGGVTYAAAAGWETGVGVSSLVSGDFDGDGITDFVFTGYSNTAIRMFRGLGDGRLAPAGPISNDGYPPVVFDGDFDRDGNLDLGISSDGGTRFLLGNGDGTFRSGQSYSAFSALRSADFTGDGLLDLLATYGNTGFQVVVGNGDGTFGQAVATTFSYYVNTLTPFDINGDGKSDLAFYELDNLFQNGALHVLMSNGDGTFAETYSAPTGVNPRSIFFADVTGDDKADLLAAEGPTGLLLFIGHGDGTFDDPVVLDASYAESVVAADFDGDGVPDLVESGAGPNGGRFYKGLGGGSFAPAAPLDLGGGTVQSVASVVGSGPDVVLLNNTNYYDSFFSVLWTSRLAPSLLGRSALVGTPAALTVSAMGYGPLSYQWRKSGIPIPGATAPALTLDPVAFTDAGPYDVLVTDSCSSVASNAATLSVEFADVPTSNIFHGDIITIATAGITAGCGGSNYCPSSLVTRAQMAVFLLRSEHGASYVPPACAGVFSDVACPSPFADWIERLAAEGVTAGCGGTNYCPDASITRAQLAVFLLKTLLGSSYTPPSATGIFGDVPVGSFAADWIEDLYARGIAGGCSLSPLLYCPGNPANRAQMAAFLVNTFALP